jgi:hypothetical protein
LKKVSINKFILFVFVIFFYYLICFIDFSQNIAINNHTEYVFPAERLSSHEGFQLAMEDFGSKDVYIKRVDLYNDWLIENHFNNSAFKVYAYIIYLSKLVNEKGDKIHAPTSLRSFYSIFKKLFLHSSLGKFILLFI